MDPPPPEDDIPADITEEDMAKENWPDDDMNDLELDQEDGKGEVGDPDEPAVEEESPVDEEPPVENEPPVEADPNEEMESTEIDDEPTKA